jgi:capsular exopolysaccharide synthesis family protein
VGIDDIQTDIRQKEELANQMAKQKSLLEVELLAPARVTKLDEAHVAFGKDELRKAKASGIAGLAVLFLAIFGVAFFEARIHRIASVDTVKQSLGLKIMGTLPVIEPKTKKGGPRSYAQDLMIESVDALRTLLMYDARAEGHRSVMVTSAVGGEGKTSLSCHLAASLARAGQRTVLVDGDLRRPSAHRLFGVSVSKGLSELLRGEATIDEVMQPTEMSGLWMIAAGRSDLLALQALDQKIGGIFDQLKGHYDFIIVDSPPVLPVADSLLIGQYVDAVVFSILRDVSRLPAVYAANERIGMLGIKVLGAVFSGVLPDRYKASYDYQYLKSRRAEGGAGA